MFPLAVRTELMKLFLAPVNMCYTNSQDQVSVSFATPYKQSLHKLNAIVMSSCQTFINVGCPLLNNFAPSQAIREKFWNVCKSFFFFQQLVCVISKYRIWIEYSQYMALVVRVLVYFFSLDMWPMQTNNGILLHAVLNWGSP